jgi:hypothetical protein
MRLATCLSILSLSASLAHAGLREASVKICNPTTGDVGSGTLVASDADCFYGLTSGHLFGFDQAKVGKLFNCESKDYHGTGKLLAISPKPLDVAVFSVQRVEGLDVVPIATEAPKLDRPFVLSGFPGGKFRQAEANLNTDHEYLADETPLYAFDLVKKSNGLGAGVSGGAVTQGGKLYTTISAANKAHTFAAAYTSFYRFAERDYQNCFGQQCRVVRLVQRGTPAVLTTSVAAPAIVTQRFIQTAEVPAPVPDELMEMRNEMQVMKGQLAVLTSTLGQLTTTMRQQATMASQQAVTTSAICPTCPPVTGSMSAGVSSFSFPGEVISSRVISSYEIPCPPLSFSSGGFVSSTSYGSPGGFASSASYGSPGGFGQSSYGSPGFGPSVMSRPIIMPIIIRRRAARRLGEAMIMQNMLSGGRGGY